MSTNEEQEIQNKNPLGFKRVWLAFGYSMDGLKHASNKEPAFQQELMLAAAMTLLALIAPLSAAVKVALIVSHFFVLIVELLNSAIEAIVDKASPEYSVLAKRAKDMGSAAVLLSFCISATLWGYAIYTYFS